MTLDGTVLIRANLTRKKNPGKLTVQNAGMIVHSDQILSLTLMPPADFWKRALPDSSVINDQHLF